MGKFETEPIPKAAPSSESAKERSVLEARIDNFESMVVACEGHARVARLRAERDRLELEFHNRSINGNVAGPEDMQRVNDQLDLIDSMIASEAATITEARTKMAAARHTIESLQGNSGVNQSEGLHPHLAAIAARRSGDEHPLVIQGKKPDLSDTAPIEDNQPFSLIGPPQAPTTIREAELGRIVTEFGNIGERPTIGLFPSDDQQFPGALFFTDYGINKIH